MIVISIFSAFCLWVLGWESRYIVLTDEVVYSVVCGLVLLATLMKCTQQLGGK